MTMIMIIYVTASVGFAVGFLTCSILASSKEDSSEHYGGKEYDGDEI